MRPRLLLTVNYKFAVDFFARGLHTRTAVARLPLRQLGFLVVYLRLIIGILSLCISAHLTVLPLLNPVLNLTYSLWLITSSHSHVSASDSIFDIGAI